MLEFKLNRDKGVRQGGIGVNSDGFLQHWTRGVSTPDLIVMEFRIGCRWKDLASACVLCPLNRLVLVFTTGGFVDCTSGGLGYTGPEMAEGIIARGGVEMDSINGK